MEQKGLKKHCLTVPLPLFVSISRTTTEAFDSDMMAQEFREQFTPMALTMDQELVFSIPGKKNLILKVKSLDGESHVICYFKPFTDIFYDCI